MSFETINDLSQKNYNALLFLVLKSINEKDKYKDLEKKVLLELQKDLSLIHFQNEDLSSKKRVFLTCNWCSSTQLMNLWNKMSKDNNYTWNDIRIVDQEPCDFYCIINRPSSDDFVHDPERTVIFRMEPYMEKDEKQWGKWTNPDVNLYKFVGNHNLHYNNNEWHLKKTYQELMNDTIVKNEEYSNVLSTILSEKYKDPGHIKRIDFIKYIEQKLEVHVYGSNQYLYKNYKHPLPPYEKDESLIPYKYGFNVENHSIKNYYTEKIIDGILSETLMFYSGCFNLKDYIDERAFVYLELSNFEHDLGIIKKAMEEDWYTQRLPYIKEAKQKILNELQFFPRLEKILE